LTKAQQAPCHGIFGSNVFYKRLESGFYAGESDYRYIEGAMAVILPTDFTYNGGKFAGSLRAVPKWEIRR
jgi:hypothetical protein